MFNSIVQERGSVPFPKYTGERVYMREIRKSKALPSDLARWQSTVDAMLDNIDAEGPIYLMIDQAVVQGGRSHRRPGVHLDGYWIPSIQAHGGGGGHSSHRGQSGGWDTGGGWSTVDFTAPEGIILASSVAAARGLHGAFDGEIGEGGDCSQIDISGMLSVPMAAGIAYAGNVTMLHESLPVAQDCLRTVVRLNVPGWSPELIVS